MNPPRSRKSNTLRPWLSSFTTACGLTLAILLLLAFVHREQPPLPPSEEGSGIRLETISLQEESGAPSASSATPNFAALLPTAKPTVVTPLIVTPPSIDVSVDLSQLLEWRYSYADMGSSSAQSASFGVSNFSDVDQEIQTIIIPPKLFPDELIDAGVLEGRVVVKLLIDERGHVQVKNVLSSTHASLVPIIVEAMNRSVYSIPIRDGKPTKAIINRTVVFNADPEHVAKRQAANSL